MALRKTQTKKDEGSSLPSVDLKVAGAGVVKIKDLLAKVLVIQRISSLLSILFYLVWIPVGLFFLWFIFANFKLGAFDQLMQPKESPTSEAVAQPQNAPTETNLPGVGKVNVACVQSNLSEDAILKMVQNGGIEQLSADEKAKLEPCVVEKEATSTEASPAPKQ